MSTNNSRPSIVNYPTIPARGLRVVGDVHGDLRGFEHAVATELFILQLGDLVDFGPDSGGVLRLIFQLIDEGRGCFLLGNHELRLARALSGRITQFDETIQATISQLDTALAARFLAEVDRAPAWVLLGHRLFVHAGFHTAMLAHAPPIGGPLKHGRANNLLGRALFGESTGRVQPDGYPERSLRWVDRIPNGFTVYCGHDCRSTNGRPHRRINKLGGEAIFVDTGAGKGGHLSWIDLH